MLTFDPPQLTQYDKWCYFEGFFSKEECSEIKSLWSPESERQAFTGKDRDPSKHIDLELRSSKICWIGFDQKTEWIFSKLMPTVQAVNDSRYQFNLTGFLEEAQLTKYAPGGHYSWHEDFGNGSFSKRKLSLIVQLSEESEYTGGEVEIFPEFKIPKKIGSLAFFPSFVTHRVNPILTGERMSMVAWISGPPFR